jgi:hypothetical protein
VCGGGAWGQEREEGGQQHAKMKASRGESAEVTAVPYQSATEIHRLGRQF